MAKGLPCRKLDYGRNVWAMQPFGLRAGMEGRVFSAREVKWLHNNRAKGSPICTAALL
jgi:hypothetical protein